MNSAGYISYSVSFAQPTHFLGWMPWTYSYDDLTSAPPLFHHDFGYICTVGGRSIPGSYSNIRILSRNLTLRGNDYKLHTDIPLSPNDIFPQFKFFLTSSQNTCIHSKNWYKEKYDGGELDQKTGLFFFFFVCCYDCLYFVLEGTEAQID